MRAILLVICIFNVTLAANAQLFGKNWQEGSYYDTLGHKTTGLVAWSRPDKTSKTPGDHIFFKSGKKSDKLKIESSLISAFTMGADSFVVTHVMALQHAPFLQVCINRPVKLYFSDKSVMSVGGAILGGVAGGAVGGILGGQAFSGEYGAPAYYYGINPDELHLLTYDNFVTMMCKIMADKPDIVDKIKSKKFRHSNLKDLIIYYNTGTMPYHDDY